MSEVRIVVRQYSARPTIKELCFPDAESGRAVLVNFVEHTEGVWQVAITAMWIGTVIVRLRRESQRPYVPPVSARIGPVP